MLTRKMRVPYAVGLVLAGIGIYFFHFTSLCDIQRPVHSFRALGTCSFLAIERFLGDIVTNRWLSGSWPGSRSAAHEAELGAPIK